MRMFYNTWTDYVVRATYVQAGRRYRQASACNSSVSGPVTHPHSWNLHLTTRLNIQDSTTDYMEHSPLREAASRSVLNKSPILYLLTVHLTTLCVAHATKQGMASRSMNNKTGKEVERSGRGQICLEGLRKENRKIQSRSPVSVRDLNPVPPPVYKAKMPTIRSLHQMITLQHPRTHSNGFTLKRRSCADQ
jgi:hypothetical protein